MGERKLVLHELVLFAVLFGLTIWRLFAGSWSFGYAVLIWWLGAILGFCFVFLDRIVYVFWQKPEETLSLTLREILGEGRLMKGLATLLSERQVQQHLMMRSVLFLGVWVALGLLTWTSVSTVLGRGFMFGLGLHLTFDLLTDAVWNRRNLELWFWQIKRKLSPVEMKLTVWGFVILFLVIAWGL